jgi:hypothetical protein
MGQWGLALCLTGALAGALLFLSLVAHELRLLDRSLQLRKALEAERQARRQSAR